MSYRLKKTVVLVGMMGSGKSAVGAALARMLAVPFRDSDAEIEKAANMSISEIFERDGERFFRRKETQVLARLLTGNVGVLSTGGGAFLAETNRELIAERGVAVWLRADLDLLWMRVKSKSSRPLLQTKDPIGTLRDLKIKREGYYGSAGLIVDAHVTYSIEDMAEKVIEALLTRPDVLERTD